MGRARPRAYLFAKISLLRYVLWVAATFLTFSPRLGRRGQASSGMAGKATNAQVDLGDVLSTDARHALLRLSRRESRYQAALR